LLSFVEDVLRIFRLLGTYATDVVAQSMPERKTLFLAVFVLAISPLARPTAPVGQNAPAVRERWRLTQVGEHRTLIASIKNC